MQESAPVTRPPIRLTRTAWCSYRGGWALALSCLLGVVVPAQVGSGAVDTVVVCHPSWQADLGPWLDLRSRQGHEITVIAPQSDVPSMRTELGKWYRTGSLRHVVFIGDTTGTTAIPTGQATATVSVPFGAASEFPSDFTYTDLDDNGTPDVTFGRISVNQRTQLQSVLARIIRYESAIPAGEWQQRVEIVGGLGGFGPFVDGAVERAVQTLLVNGVPIPYRTGLTYANWKSPYCPSIRHFQDIMLERYNSGCLLWVYAGHGQVQMLDRVGSRSLLGHHEVHRLQSLDAAPIAALLSCHAGNFHAEDECLAEAMFRTPGGPIAILAGTSISMPYGSISLADALLRATFSETKGTLGESLLAAQRELIDPQAPSRRWIDQVAGLLGTSAEARQAERLEHIRMFHLLGDPLLRLPLPATAQVNIPATAQAGDSIHVQLNSPLAGKGKVAIACQRGCFRFPSRQRTGDELHNPVLQRVWDREHQAANADTWYETEHTFAEGATEFDLQVPAEAHGHCYVRVFIANPSQSAVGGAPVYIRNTEAKPPTPSPP